MGFCRCFLKKNVLRDGRSRPIFRLQRGCGFQWYFFKWLSNFSLALQNTSQLFSLEILFTFSEIIPIFVSRKFTFIKKNNVLKYWLLTALKYLTIFPETATIFSVLSSTTISYIWCCQRPPPPNYMLYCIRRGSFSTPF